MPHCGRSADCVVQGLRGGDPGLKALLGLKEESGVFNLCCKHFADPKTFTTSIFILAYLVQASSEDRVPG